MQRPKIQTHGKGEQPFATSNAALAFALYSAGVPFTDPRNPCRNEYTEEIVFRAGGGQEDDSGNAIRTSRYSGMTLEDGTKAAFEEGKKGHVTFLFQFTKNLSRLKKAFADQEKEFTESDIVGTELIAKIIKSVAAQSISAEEGIVRMACVNLKMRTAFMNLWKNYVPMIRVNNPGQPITRDTPEGKVISHPGFKMISVNLSEKKRKHIKL